MSDGPILIKSISECTKEEQLLLTNAASARLKAQAPYTHFYVGAAVINEIGNTYQGCNVERCGLSQTTHAIQNAVDTMITHDGPVKIKTIAIVGASSKNDLQSEYLEKIEASPLSCGHCLQIVWENSFDDPNINIISFLAKGRVGVTTIGKALPIRFGPRHLNVSYKKMYP